MFKILSDDSEINKIGYVASCLTVLNKIEKEHQTDSRLRCAYEEAKALYHGAFVGALRGKDAQQQADLKEFVKWGEETCKEHYIIPAKRMNCDLCWDELKKLIKDSK